MYAKLPWHRRYRVPFLIFAMVLILCLAFFVTRSHAYEYDDTVPLTMTEEQINDLYGYVRELEMENEHLKNVINLSEQTIEKASEFAVKVDTQTQALIALYEHQTTVMDGMMTRYEVALTRLDTLTDKYEKRIVSLERENGFWKIIGIVGAASAAASWSQ